MAVAVGCCFCRPTYTNLGIDDRNQFELSLSCAGGAAGLATVVDQLHDRGVRVLWAYNPWDHSTHGQYVGALHGGQLSPAHHGRDDVPAGVVVLHTRGVAVILHADVRSMLMGLWHAF